MNKLIIYSDGGARGNPGPAAIGYVILDAGGKELKRARHYLGVATNNHAEYRALIAALEAAANLGFDHIACRLDSELVVKQLNGQYKVKEPSLKPLATEALALTRKFTQVEFTHVPREQNKIADQLVNEALDEHELNG